MLICAFLIPALIVPFIKIFGLETNVGVLEKYGMFATYHETPFTLLGGSLQTFWMIANNTFAIILFIAALIYILFFILDIANVEIKSGEKIVKYLGILILVTSILAVLSGLIATLVNNVGDTNYAKIIGEPGYYLLFFPIISGILSVLPLDD